jgi:hypothetical protein
MADFSSDKKYNKFWKSSLFNETIFEKNKISELSNDSGFLNQDQTDKLYPSSQSFYELESTSLKLTTNFYVEDNYVDEYFEDVGEFFETYNTGSFTGSFEGTITANEVFTLTPSIEFPPSPLPGSFVTMLNPLTMLLSLYFFNGESWVTILE